ncbi:hypothetical protein LTR94_030406, partial [Friedmanniomyces endolithicus]
ACRCAAVERRPAHRPDGGGGDRQRRRAAGADPRASRTGGQGGDRRDADARIGGGAGVGGAGPVDRGGVRALPRSQRALSRAVRLSLHHLRPADRQGGHPGGDGGAAGERPRYRDRHRDRRDRQDHEAAAGGG